MSAAKLLQACREKGLKLATAESCTGGMIAAALTAVPGSSDVVDRGFVTYSNEAKMEMLSVQRETLDTYGAVSEQVAAEMAKGAIQNSNAQIAVSVTGIAGPGGSEFKPEGMVCFGIAISGQPVRTFEVQFGAIGRDSVRESTTRRAIDELLSALT